MGIGTITPSEKLEVSGTVKATAFDGPATAITTSATTLDPVSLDFIVKDVSGNYLTLSSANFASIGTGLPGTSTFNIGNAAATATSTIQLQGTTINMSKSCADGDVSDTIQMLATTVMIGDSDNSVVSNLTVNGSVSKVSGSFCIPHPLPAMNNTHKLYHSFIEGPRADLIYRGSVNLVNGSATVNIDHHSTMTDGTFEALNRNVDCFTTNETDWDPVRGTVNGNILSIECQNPSSTTKVSSMVVGERQDEGMRDTHWTDSTGRVVPEKIK